MTEQKTPPKPSLYYSEQQNSEAGTELLRNSGNIAHYKKGLGELLRKGCVRPCGQRVLLRAITTADINAGSGLALAGIETAAHAQPFHVVWDIDPTVAEKVPFTVGHHVMHTSAAADIADPNQRASPWVLVHWEDIIAWWEPPGEIIALDG